jgi:hypothetical protein
MSERRIGIVAEGTTDHVAITSALTAILPEAPIVTPLQPEPTLPRLGGGWCGVLKWCLQRASEGVGRLEDDPTLQSFDLVVLHVDADVGEGTYANCGFGIEECVSALGALPCVKPCPPAVDTADALHAVVLTWLGLSSFGPRTLLCIPSKAIESWVAVALLPHEHALLATHVECVDGMEGRLRQLPLAQRIRKTKLEYQRHAAPAVARRWDDIRTCCEQAERFHQAVAAALLP